MDIRKLKKLIELVNETGIAELEVEEEKERVRITRAGLAASAVVPQTPVAIAVAPSLPLPGTPDPLAAAVGVKKHTVNSPMVGTVYLAPSAGAKPFVEIGQRVKVGDILCLVEAMKMFNRIEADKDGVIISRLVENEHPVEYGQALFSIDDN